MNTSILFLFVLIFFLLFPTVFALEIITDKYVHNSIFNPGDIVNLTFLIKNDIDSDIVVHLAYFLTYPDGIYTPSTITFILPKDGIFINEDVIEIGEKFLNGDYTFSIVAIDNVTGIHRKSITFFVEGGKNKVDVSILTCADYECNDSRNKFYSGETIYVKIVHEKEIPNNLIVKKNNVIVFTDENKTIYNFEAEEGDYRIIIYINDKTFEKNITVFQKELSVFSNKETDSKNLKERDYFVPILLVITLLLFIILLFFKFKY